MLKSSVRGALAFAGSNLTSVVLLGVGSVLQARWVEPGVLGAFQKYLVLTGYLGFLHLGVFDGLQRELPLRLAKGDRSGAASAVAACLCWIMIASAGVALVFFVLAASSFARSRMFESAGWLSAMAIVIANLYGGYLAATYRTSGEFSGLARANVAKGLISVASLALLPLLHYYGICLRSAVTPIAHTVLLRRSRPFPVRPSFKPSEYLGIVKFGFPCAFVGYLGSGLWTSLQGTFVLYGLGVTGLGLFSLVYAAQQAMANLPLSMMQYYMPVVTQEWATTHSVKRCCHACVVPTMVAFSASAAAAAVGWICAGPLIRAVVPAYADATSSLQYACLIMPVTALRLPRNVLLAMGDLIGHSVSTCFGLAVFCIAAAFALSAEAGLAGLVNASTAGQLAMSACYYVFVFVRLRESRTASAPLLAHP